MTTTRILRLQTRFTHIVTLVSFAAAVLLVTYVTALWITIPISSTSTVEAERILGHDLPESAENVRTLRRQTTIDGYRGYVRYTIVPNDLSALAAPNYTRKIGVSRATEFEASSFFPPGDIQYFDRIKQRAPRWWRLPEQGELLLQFHSFGSSAAPNISWHIIDRSDPSRYIVHAYGLDF